MPRGCPQLGHLPLESLGVGHVAAMFDAITAGNAHRADRPVGPTTMQRIRATLRAALSGATGSGSSTSTSPA
jgi:hypothetical protein